MSNPNIITEIEAVRRLFGQHPEDVLGPTQRAAEAFGWLEEILLTISKEALNERNGIRIRRLAEAGAYLAVDMGTLVERELDDMSEKLRKAGAIAGEAS
jgi:hypothetical protein